MRLAVRFGTWSAVAPILAGCATGGSGPTGAAVDRACGVEDCFFERDVRDFEVLNDTTLILYVGAQRCPFQVELEGTFCDMTMAPEVYFRTEERRIRERTRGIEETVNGRPGVISEVQRRDQERQRNMALTRICSYDRVEVDGGSFTEVFEQPRGAATQRSSCTIRSVASLTDDQLVELYVDRGVVAPPPPIGPGEIEVQAEEQGSAPDSADAEAGAAEDASAETASQPASTAAASDRP